MNNEYVARMMSMLINKPMNVVWLCDYTDAEPDDEDTWTWDNTDEMKYMDMSEYIDMKYYVLNHTKEVFIDIQKLEKLYREDGRSSWHIHPVPLLTNSEDGSMGGGDFHKDDERRSIWKRDELEVTLDIEKVKNLGLTQKLNLKKWRFP